MKNLMKVLLLVAGTSLSVNQAKAITTSIPFKSEKAKQETSLNPKNGEFTLSVTNTKDISEPKKATGLFSNKKNTSSSKAFDPTFDQTKELDAKIEKEQIQGQDEKDLADLLKCEEAQGNAKAKKDTFNLN